jgi:hypothetical protein
VLEAMQRIREEGHLETPKTLSSLAVTKRRQGNLTRAKELGWKASDSTQSTLGGEHAWTLDTLADVL